MPQVKNYIYLFVAIVFFSLLSVKSAAEASSDVRIVIDVSGSMKETDPQNLRRPALNLLTQVLPEGSEAGVWTFGRYVNMLVPHAEVTDGWRQSAKSSATEINSIALRTNLVGALEQALSKKGQKPNSTKSIILLTDGRIDMDSTEGDPSSTMNAAERRRLFEQLLPKFKDQNVQIHTLALSDASDQVLLRRLSMETGGIFLQAKTADDLMPAFLKAFDRAVPAEQVPLMGNRFSIDPSVKEFTALIFRAASSTKETALVSPSGKRYSAKSAKYIGNVRWHKDLNFDLITVAQPEAGEWSVEADLDQNNRVQILSDLKLKVTGLPGSLFAGVPIELGIMLSNEGETVKEPEILQLTDITLQITAPDGKTGSKILSDPENLPLDGVFREELSRFRQAGEYRIEVNAMGRTFQRRQILTTSLAEPMKITTRKEIDRQVFSIEARSGTDMLDHSLSRIMAKVSSPDGNSLIQSMEYQANTQSWNMELTGARGEGEYRVDLTIRGVSSSGMTFKSNPEHISVTFPLTDQFPSAPSTSSVQKIVNPDSIQNAGQEQPQAIIQPDLATKFEEQQESVRKVPVVAKQPEVTQQAEEEVTEEPDEGIAWWIYLIIGLTNLAIIGGAAWWWLSRRKLKQAEEGKPEEARPEASEPEEKPDFSEEDLEPGEVELFGADDEAEKTESADEAEKAEPEKESSPTIPVAGDADMIPEPDAAAPTPEETGEDPDDWGEFDLEDEPNDEPKDS